MLREVTFESVDRILKCDQIKTSMQFVYPLALFIERHKVVHRS